MEQLYASNKGQNKLKFNNSEWRMSEQICPHFCLLWILGSEEFSSIQFWTGIASVSKGMAQ